MDEKHSMASVGAPDAEAGKRGAQHGRPDLDVADRLRSAQEALLARPRRSIRLKLVASLLLCFFLCCAFTLLSLDLLHQTRARLRLLQTIERLDDRILRVRTLADEDILSSGDLERVLAGAKDAERLPNIRAPKDWPSLATRGRPTKNSISISSNKRLKYF